MLLKAFFIVTIFLATACSSKKQPLLSASLTAEEKADLEYFFQLLIFKNYGAFVLFGSKPLCEMHLSDEESAETKPAFQKWLDSLPDDKREEMETIINKLRNRKSVDSELERNPYRGWRALEKVLKNFKMKNFLFRLVPVHFPNSSELIPGSYELVLINIQQTALVLAENYEIFKTASGMDFHPLQMVFEAQNPDSIFWKNVFSMQNHLTKGLLFGFGLRNSLFCNWSFSVSSNAQFALGFSEEYRENIMEYLKNSHDNVSTASVPFCKGSLSNFTIPLFGVVPGDDTAEKYKKEKAAIEKIYRGQDVVEVTLRHFAGL